jgi:hypothetical protein
MFVIFAAALPGAPKRLMYKGRDGVSRGELSRGGGDRRSTSRRVDDPPLNVDDPSIILMTRTVAGLLHGSQKKRPLRARHV